MAKHHIPKIIAQPKTLCATAASKKVILVHAKPVSHISEEHPLYTAFLDTNRLVALSWQKLNKLNEKVTQFKLNTGAEVTAFSPDTYKSLLFKGLGNVAEEYHIQLKPEAKPLAM